jgi:hypothetical protein
VSDRWQESAERTRRIRARLGEVEESRIRLEATEALARGNLDTWSRRRSDERLAGNRKGLDAAIGMALYDKADVPVELIAEAAGVDVNHVERVRARLKGL